MSKFHSGAGLGISLEGTQYAAGESYLGEGYGCWGQYKGGQYAASEFCMGEGDGCWGQYKGGQYAAGVLHGGGNGCGISRVLSMPQEVLRGGGSGQLLG